MMSLVLPIILRTALWHLRSGIWFDVRKLWRRSTSLMHSDLLWHCLSSTFTSLWSQSTNNTTSQCPRIKIVLCATHLLQHLLLRRRVSGDEILRRWVLYLEWRRKAEDDQVGSRVNIQILSRCKSQHLKSSETKGRSSTKTRMLWGRKIGTSS